MNDEGMFRVIYWNDGQRYVDNFHWSVYENAHTWAQDMLNNDNATDAVVEKTAWTPNWSRSDHWIDAYSGEYHSQDEYVIDWDAEEKRARIRHKQLKRTKLG